MSSSETLPPALYVPIGPAACGKSTLAAKLIAGGMPADAIVSADIERGKLCTNRPCACPDAPVNCPGGVECQCVSGAAHARVGRQAGLKLLRLEPVYVDGTNLIGRGRRSYVAMAHEAGMPAVALLAVQRTVVDLLARNASRDRQVPDFVIEKMHGTHAGITQTQLREEGFDVVVTFDDNSVFAVADQATAAAS